MIAVLPYLIRGKDGYHSQRTSKSRGVQGIGHAGTRFCGIQNEVALTKALELYMNGKTYTEIFKIVGIKKDIILYLAQKFDWYDTKIEQLQS